MNGLGSERRRRVVSCLVQGMSISLTVRVTGVARNTIVKLLRDLGVACSQYLDHALRNLPCAVIECDEIWSFASPKSKTVPTEGEFGLGDVWTWTAIDTETKLVPSWLVGRRDKRDCYAFLSDLRSRIAHPRIELRTSGHAPYLSTIQPLFRSALPDHALLIKDFDGGDHPRNSSSAYAGIEPHTSTGNSRRHQISTPHPELTHLTMRMGMSGITRTSNAFSRKVESHAAAISLHFMFYNFAVPQTTFADAMGTRKQITPAMAAGVATHVWSIPEIAALLG